MNSSEKTATLLKLLGRAPYVHSVTELGEQIAVVRVGPLNACITGKNRTGSADTGT